MIKVSKEQRVIIEMDGDEAQVLFNVIRAAQAYLNRNEAGIEDTVFEYKATTEMRVLMGQILTGYNR